MNKINQRYYFYPLPNLPGGKEPEVRAIYSPNSVHSLPGMFFRNSFRFWHPGVTSIYSRMRAR